MKRLLSVSLALALLLLAGCSGREEGGSAEEQDNSTSPASEQPASNEESVQAPDAPDEAGETAEQEPDTWSPADYPDPTLPENMDGPYYTWEHLEYLSFGQPDGFHTVQTILEKDGQPHVTVTLRLPDVFSVEEPNGEIYYNGGFHEPLKVGDVLYIDPDPGMSFTEYGLQTARQRSTEVTLLGVDVEMVEQDANSSGSYIATDKYVRSVFSEGYGNNVLYYLIKASDDDYVTMGFLVSEQADTGNLALYDAIADSIQVHS